jgi:hypothetical protein
MSERLKILLVGYELLGADRSAEYLQNHAAISWATLKRYLRDLRHMGCEIVCRREPSGSLYRLENPEAVQEKLITWLRLEREHTLV